MVAAAVGIGGSLISGVVASDAASDATDAQTNASNAQIAESRRQYEEARKLLEPYVSAGTGALGQQQSILGLNGASQQNSAIQGIVNSPYAKELMRQGESGILANASATGGLRGGNVQGALAQYRPNMMNSLINHQYDRLSGLTSIGQNSAAGVGAAGQNSSNQIISALGNQGAISAGNSLAQGQAFANTIGGLGKAAGMAFDQYSSNPTAGVNNYASVDPSSFALGGSNYTGFTKSPMF